jgi:hypothetical protein
MKKKLFKLSGVAAIEADNEKEAAKKIAIALLDLIGGSDTSVSLDEVAPKEHKKALEAARTINADDLLLSLTGTINVLKIKPRSERIDAMIEQTEWLRGVVMAKSRL